MSDHILSQEEIDALLRSREGNGSGSEAEGLDEGLLNEIFSVAVRGAEGPVMDFLAVEPDELEFTDITARVAPWEEVAGALLAPGIAWVGDLSEGLEGVAVGYTAQESGELISASFAEPEAGEDPSEVARAWTGELLEHFARGVVDGLATVLGQGLTAATAEVVTVEDPTQEETGLPVAAGETCLEVSLTMNAGGETLAVHLVIPGDVAGEILRLLAVQASGEEEAGESAAAAEPEPEPQPQPQEEPQARTQASEPAPSSRPQRQVQVEPARFAPLSGSQAAAEGQNIGMILDVPLQVTVELGRTQKQIKEILALGKGSVIQLEKLAGEMVDILVNGKLIAKGEVVVIDENFGVKITDIISPVERVQHLQ